MKTLVIGDPSGSHCAQLIEKKNINPEDIVVWEDSEIHKFRILCVDSRITITDKLETLKNMKFTRIIGNPPYQANTKSSGNTLWDKFIVQCLELLEDDGTLSFITPPRWRQPEDALQYIYKKYQLVSLEIHSAKDGKATFNANTPYDVYTIKKVAPTEPTQITFDDGTIDCIDVTQLPFIPNSNWQFWSKCFATTSKKIECLWGYSHDSRLRHMSKTQSSVHCYPITHNFTDDGLTFMYSSKQHEYQNHPKVLIRDQGNPKPVYDFGQYGCGRHTIFIPVENESEANQIIDFLNSPEFISIRSSATFSQRQFGPKPFNYIPFAFIQNDDKK
jgi:hypothetical protein